MVAVDGRRWMKQATMETCEQATVETKGMQVEGGSEEKQEREGYRRQDKFESMKVREQEASHGRPTI